MEGGALGAGAGTGAMARLQGHVGRKRSDETLGWWMSMAAVVTTHTAGSGAAVCKERRGAGHTPPRPHLCALMGVGLDGGVR